MMTKCLRRVCMHSQTSILSVCLLIREVMRWYFKKGSSKLYEVLQYVDESKERNSTYKFKKKPLMTDSVTHSMFLRAIKPHFIYLIWTLLFIHAVFLTLAASTVVSVVSLASALQGLH